MFTFARVELLLKRHRLEVHVDFFGQLEGLTKFAIVLERRAQVVLHDDVFDHEDLGRGAHSARARVHRDVVSLRRVHPLVDAFHIGLIDVLGRLHFELFQRGRCFLTHVQVRQSLQKSLVGRLLLRRLHFLVPGQGLTNLVGHHEVGRVDVLFYVLLWRQHRVRMLH